MWPVTRLSHTGRGKQAFQYDSVTFPGYTFVFNIKMVLPGDKYKLECSGCRQAKKKYGGVNPIIYMKDNAFTKDPDSLKHICIQAQTIKDTETVKNETILKYM